MVPNLSLTAHQQEAIEEYRELGTAEDRLTYLIERVALEALLVPSDCDDSCKVPGCLSGLWLVGSMKDGDCYFRCRSESQVVEGIVALLCDLTSGHSPKDVINVTQTLVPILGLEQLLTLTRKASVAKSVAFMSNFASRLLQEAA